MKQCAILIAAIAWITGCATHSGSSARHETGSGKITPLPSESAQASKNNTPPAQQGAGEFTEIPLYREQLAVGKREIPKGTVVIRKIVSTQTTNIPVQLRREDIVVERLQANDPRAADYARTANAPFAAQEVVVDLSREVSVVETSAIPTEVVRAQKTVSQHEQQIADTVRIEEVNIDRQMAENNPTVPRGNVIAAGAAPQGEVGAAASERADRAELVLHQEQLNVGTRAVPRGRVVAHKTVRNEQVSQPVQLRTEDVQIDRGPARAGVDQGQGQAFQSREIVIPLFE